MTLLILLNFLLCFVILGVCYLLVRSIPLPHPFALVVQVIFVLIAVLAILGLFRIGSMRLPMLL